MKGNWSFWIHFQIDQKESIKVWLLPILNLWSHVDSNFPYRILIQRNFVKRWHLLYLQVHMISKTKDLDFWHNSAIQSTYGKVMHHLVLTHLVKKFSLHDMLSLNVKDNNIFQFFVIYMKDFKKLKTPLPRHSIHLIKMFWILSTTEGKQRKLRMESNLPSYSCVMVQSSREIKLSTQETNAGRNKCALSNFCTDFYFFLGQSYNATFLSSLKTWKKKRMSR